MKTTIQAREYLGSGFPPKEGARLADALLREVADWDDLTVDLTKCSPGLLISAFFNAFLQRIYDQKPELLPKARKVRWDLAYPFQQENAARWVQEFAPNPGPR